VSWLATEKGLKRAEECRVWLTQHKLSPLPVATLYELDHLALHNELDMDAVDALARRSKLNYVAAMFLLTLIAVAVVTSGIALMFELLNVPVQTAIATWGTIVSFIIACVVWLYWMEANR